MNVYSSYRVTNTHTHTNTHTQTNTHTNKFHASHYIPPITIYIVNGRKHITITTSPSLKDHMVVDIYICFLYDVYGKPIKLNVVGIATLYLIYEHFNLKNCLITGSIAL